MLLRKANANLMLLSLWLVQSKKLPAEILNLSIIHDPQLDRDNLLNPRAFCYVAEGQKHIYCAAAVEKLPEQSRVGILLHEIGHVHLQAFHGDESEVDVDAWIVNNIPESGYTYQDVSYRNLDTSRKVSAKNLQIVSKSFVEKIYGV